MKTKKEQLRDLITEYGCKNYELGILHDFKKERELAKDECKRVFEEMNKLLTEFPD